MSVTDELLKAAEQGITIAARYLGSEILGRIFGDNTATDGAVERVARAAAQAALEAAEHEARNGVAAKLLPVRMREIAEKIERDMAEAFKPTGDVTDIGVDIDIDVEDEDEFARTVEENKRREAAGEIIR